MSDFETHISRKLDQDDEAFLQELEAGQGFFSQLGSTFKGPLGLISMLVLATAFVFVLLAIWFAWEAFHAEAVRDVVLWCTGVILCLLANGLLRIWLFNRMNHLVALKALKKMELRLIKLDERL